GCPALAAILAKASDEAISPLGDRLDRLGVLGDVDQLLAKNEDQLREVALPHHHVRPSRVDQLLAGDELASSSEEEPEHVDRLGGKGKPLAGAVDGTSARIEPERTEFVAVWLRRGA